jgi:hypothetical protein
MECPVAITRTQAEQILLRRVGGLLEQAGLDYQSNDGTNADLNDPIASAVMSLGYTVSDISNVASSDLSSLDASENLAFLDLAEYRALESINGHIIGMKISVGPITEDYGDLIEQIDERLKRLKTKIESEHSVGFGSTLEIGVIDMNFQARSDDTIV